MSDLGPVDDWQAGASADLIQLRCWRMAREVEFLNRSNCLNNSEFGIQTASRCCETAWGDGLFALSDNVGRQGQTKVARWVCDEPHDFSLFDNSIRQLRILDDVFFALRCRESRKGQDPPRYVGHTKEIEFQLKLPALLGLPVMSTLKRRSKQTCCSSDLIEILPPSHLQAARLLIIQFCPSPFQI